MHPTEPHYYLLFKVNSTGFVLHLGVWNSAASTLPFSGHPIFKAIVTHLPRRPIFTQFAIFITVCKQVWISQIQLCALKCTWARSKLFLLSSSLCVGPQTSFPSRSPHSEMETLASVPAPLWRSVHAGDHLSKRGHQQTFELVASCRLVGYNKQNAPSQFNDQCYTQQLALAITCMGGAFPE